MLRLLYSLCLYLLSPAIFLRLAWRARKQPEYLANIGERFGFYGQRRAAGEAPLIWVHAVSVGETRAAQPLVEALQAAWPTHRILLTGMTPTGRAAGREVFGERVIQAYLPYDLPDAVGRFFRHFAPDFGILMETEIWPNLLAAAERREIPVVLVNARLSERSARGYARFGGLTRPAFGRLAAVAAQTAGDGERLAALTAPQVEVCGNLKFDVEPPAERLATGRAWRAGLGPRPVWLAASTREGEEGPLLDAWLRRPVDDALLVLVPRHPQRFAEVAAMLEQRGLRWQKRSVAQPSAATQVWLGDSMGEMAAYYALADFAFIGGSLAPLGGQNLIEAAACGCPVIVGPHTFNFLRATEDAIAAGAARRVADADALVDTVHRLFQEDQELAAMRAACAAFAAAHRGATQRTLALIARRCRRAAR